MVGVQIGPTSIRVTRTPPDPLNGITGYRIDYTTGGGSSGSQSVSGGNTNSYTLTGFTNGEIYSLTIISTVSVGLPSTNQEVVTVGLSKSLYNTYVRFFPMCSTYSTQFHSWLLLLIHLQEPLPRPSQSLVEFPVALW